MTDVAAEAVLFRSAPTARFEPWVSIDDGVMGGASRGALVPADDGTVCFTGTVSLENNGGFCSVRSPDRGRLGDGWDAIVLRVRGDGKTYTLCLHTRHLLPGTSYRCRFTPPAGGWASVTLPLADFVLMRYGYRAGVTPVNPAQVTGVSLMISDRQDGPFALGLAEVRMVRTAR